jgi:hypothetical protein
MRSSLLRKPQPRSDERRSDSAPITTPAAGMPDTNPKRQRGFRGLTGGVFEEASLTLRVGMSFGAGGRRLGRPRGVKAFRSKDGPDWLEEVQSLECREWRDFCAPALGETN